MTELSFITIFAAPEEQGVLSEGLQRITQLVILMIPLFTIPMLLKGSSSMLNKIGGVADRISRDIGVERAGNSPKKNFGKATASGIGMAKGGLKNQALNLEARAASRGGALGAVGGYRTRRKFKLGNQERERQRAQSDALGQYITSGDATNFNQRAAGVAGEKGVGRVAAMFAGEEQKRVQEEISNAKAIMENDKDFGHNSLGVANKFLASAHKNGDKAGVRAALSVLSSAEPGVDMVREFIQNNEKNMNSEQRSAIAAGINDNWTSFKTRDHAVSSWSSAYDAEGSLHPSLEAAQESNPYKGLNADQLSTQTTQTLKLATSKGYITQRMAEAVLKSESSKNLPDEKRALFERIAQQTQTQSSPSTAPSQNEPRAASGGGNFDQQSGGGVWIPRE
jgi:hypothetical protein